MSPTSILLLLALGLSSTDPWADGIVQWIPGTGGSTGYDQPEAVLGEPTRQTVDDEIVSPFVPSWGTDEIVSIGAGGSIVVVFNEPVVDHPENPWGVDLLIFGNAGFIDASAPDGVCAGVFGADGGELEVSSDGTTWHSIALQTADDLWPTMAYRDAAPYTTTTGSLATSFVRPMNPELNLDACIGLEYDALVMLYDGSGGGTGIDLAPLGLTSIRYVRISVPEDAFFSPELDAIVDVAPHRFGDVNHDGFINIGDLLLVLEAWNTIGSSHADVDGNGHVDISDLLVVIAGWGAEPW